MTQQYARLTHSQWDEVKGFLPLERKRKYALRDVFDALLWGMACWPVSRMSSLPLPLTE